MRIPVNVPKNRRRTEKSEEEKEEEETRHKSQESCVNDRRWEMIACARTSKEGTIQKKEKESVSLLMCT